VEFDFDDVKWSKTRSSRSYQPKVLRKEPGKGKKAVRETSNMISKKRHPRFWTEEEVDRLADAIRLFDKDWSKMRRYVGSKTEQ